MSTLKDRCYEYSENQHAADCLVRITEEFAIDFANWIMDRGFHFNVWPTTNELLEMYKREKGL